MRMLLGAAAAVGLAFVAAACSTAGSKPTPTPAPSSTPAATTMPSPTPSPTVDATAAQVEKVYGEIVAMRATAAGILLDLQPIADLYTGTTVRSATGAEAADFAKRWDRVSASCKSVTVPALRPDADLWPGPYSDLDAKLWAVCQLIIDRAKTSPPAASDEWTAVAVSVTRALAEATGKLPDYSIAQLHRAIADRQ